MLPTTTDAVRSILKTDPSLTPADRTRILAGIRNHGRGDATTAPDTPALSRILKRQEVAERMGRSLRFVDKLAKDGILPKKTLPGRTRSVGFPSEAVERLLAAGGVQ